MTEPQIIFEDSEMLVINKPPGMIVNRSDTAKGEVTLQDWVLSCIFRHSRESGNLDAWIPDQVRDDENEKDEEFFSRSGIVHRLDKDTSGVMLIAKSTENFQRLKDQFKTRKVKKFYLALAHGRFEKREGEISAPIDRNPQNRFRFAIIEGGRAATTLYQVTTVYEREGEVYSLVSLEPLTGRTHQIRVHLNHLGHPLVSDSLYLGAKTLKKDLLFCPRIFLHALSIGFFHPKNDSWMKVEAELPDDLTSTLKLLQIPQTS
ncbi:MAG: RluA family pseudouridine synthase [Patescibacteria group bacterium]